MKQIVEVEKILLLSHSMITVTITNEQGEVTKRSFALGEGLRCRIGRDESCEISLPEESYLSRVHCIIMYENGQLLIQDAQSSNGLFLQGERIMSDFLHLNEPYRLGNVTMVVSEGEADGSEEDAAGVGAEQAEQEGVQTEATDEGKEDAGTVPAGGGTGEQVDVAGGVPNFEVPQIPELTPAQNVPTGQIEGYPPQQGAPEYPAQQAGYPQQVMQQGYPGVPGYGVQGNYGGQPVAPGYPQGYGNQMAPGYMQGYGVPTGYPNTPGYPQQPYAYPQTGYTAPQGYPMGYPQPAYPQQGGYPVNYPQQVYPGMQGYPVNFPYPQTPQQPQGYAYPTAETPTPYQVPTPVEQPMPPVPPQPPVPPEPPVLPTPPVPPMPPVQMEEGGEEVLQESDEEGEGELSLEEQMAAELEEEAAPSLGKRLLDKMSSSLNSGKEKLRRWTAGLHRGRSGDETEEIWEEEGEEEQEVEESAESETEETRQ